MKGLMKGIIAEMREKPTRISCQMIGMAILRGQSVGSVCRNLTVK
jgi:hypothetical protein